MLSKRPGSTSRALLDKRASQAHREAVLFEEKILLSGWKSLAFGVIAVGGILVCMFRLDELMARRKSGPKPPKRPMGNDRKGRIAFSDPDGREWKRTKD